MVTTTKKKPPASKQAATKGGKNKVPEKRRLNRVGSQVHQDPAELKTFGQRAAARRMALGITQEHVAVQLTYIPKSGDNAGNETVLSRTAYNQYESGTVTPDIRMIADIAKVLDISPAWLAFGIAEEKKVQEFIFDSHRGFLPDFGWLFNATWVKDQYGVEPEDIGLFMLSNFSDNFIAGDMAIFEKNSEPGGTKIDTYIFAHKGMVQVANVTQPQRANVLRIFAPDLQTHREIPLKSVTILGRVLGKIGNLKRDH